MKNFFKALCRLKLPWGFVFTVACILCIETIIAHCGILIVDPSTRDLRYIRERIEDPTPDDIAVFGTRSMALDVGSFEKDLGGLSIQNYSMPHSGSNMCFPLVLRKYLHYKSRKPKIIFISIPQECFVNFIYSDNLSNIRRERMVELFGREICGKYLFKNENSPVLDFWFTPRRLFPSYREKTYIWKHFVRGNFFNLPVMVPFIKDSIRRMKATRKTKGQTLMNENRQVHPLHAVAYLPSREETLKRQWGVSSIEEFFRVANENKIPTVFFDTPLTKLRTEKMYEVGYFPYMDEVMDSFLKKYPYVSYAHIDGIRQWDVSLLADWAHHVNTQGAERFTREFAEMVKRELEKRNML